MNRKVITNTLLIVLAIVVLYAVMPSGGDGTAPVQDSGNPHAIDQD